jgi:Holliday junction resolvasome RuvABC endonuclease subunit
MEPILCVPKSLNNIDMNILALDIATNTGWCTKTSYGTWNLKPNRGESEGMRVVRFKAKVREMINLEQIGVISYERVAGQHKSSIIVASEMVGVLKDLCLELGIELCSYSAKEIKSFATGKGNANKEAMMRAAIDQGYQPGDDNAADAIHLFNLTKKDLNL